MVLGSNLGKNIFIKKILRKFCLEIIRTKFYEMDYSCNTVWDPHGIVCGSGSNVDNLLIKVAV
jgi:hypothetical protein